MDAAEGVFQNLQDVGLRPDETTYRSMIEGWGRAGNYGKVKLYYEGLKASGFKPNSSNLFTLINLQAIHDHEEAAVGTLESGHLENAVNIFTHMPKSDDRPNLHIMGTTIDIYGAMNRFSDAETLYQTLKSSGVAMDMVAFSIVVRMYVKAGSLNDACSVLDVMEKQKNIVPDVYLLRDMFRIYQRCSKLDKLENLYYKLWKIGVTWDEEMYNSVINCCAHALTIDELSRIFDEMIWQGFTPNTITYNVMLDVYGKARLFKKARKVFWMAREQGLADVITYNTLIAAYGQSKDFEEMASTVQKMEFNGFSVSLDAYNCMSDAYGKERQMENFRNVLQRMKQSSCALTTIRIIY
ncbi:hypothetical protein Ancab_027674 [Ancistrocladus abbreviatus]